MTHRATKVSLVTVFLATLVALVAWSLAGQDSQAKAASVAPEFTAGNPDCESLGYDFEFKINNDPATGAYTTASAGVVTEPMGLTFPGLVINIVNNTLGDGVLDSWSATLNGDPFGIDAVIMKGGPNANVYRYNPEASSDNNLVTPTNPSNGQPFGISHVSFCFDFELAVSKTATTTFTRDFDWTIEKSNDSGSSEADPAEIQENQPYDVEYTVVVTKDDGTDSDWAVSGTITVVNPHPTLAALGVSVSDVISKAGESDIAADVDCDPNTAGNQSSGFTIAAGGMLSCTYSADLPDGTARLNTATATTTTAEIDGDSGTANVTFGAPTTVEDDCVILTDDDFNAEFIDENDLYDLVDDDQVQVCDDAELTYTVSFNTETHPLDCGDNVIENTARLSTDDGLDETDDSTVWITRHCETTEGCTLTPGYWKTHSEYGPAKHTDATWDLILPDGQDTDFFLSGMSYYEVLWTAPQGNVYYILAHAYIAAELNQLAGADIPADVLAAFNTATTFFETTMPAAAAGLKGPAKNAITSLAMILDNYNNGITGPGHCDGEVV